MMIPWRKWTFIFIAVQLLVLALTSCFQNPYLPKAKRAAEENQIEEAHKWYVMAIQSDPDNIKLFRAYAEWIPNTVEKRAEKVRFEHDDEKEVTYLENQANNLHALQREVNQSKQFMSSACKCNRDDFEEVYNTLCRKISENHKLIDHTLNLIKDKKNKASEMSIRSMQKGEISYRKMRLDVAYDYFRKSLANNSGNVRSRQMIELINVYQNGLELIAGQELSKAKEYMENLLEKYRTDPVMHQLCRSKLAQIISQIMHAERLVHEGERLVKFQAFDQARLKYQQAIRIDRSRTDELDGRRKTIDLLEAAWNEMKMRNFGRAVDYFQLAVKQWPEQKTFEKWYKKAVRRKNEVESARLLEKGYQLMLNGEFESANKHFDQALDIAPSKKAAKKMLARYKSKIRKLILKTAAVAKKSGDFLGEYKAYSHCVKAVSDKACKKKRDRLGKTLIAKYRDVAEKAGKEDQWARALLAFAIILKLDSEDKDLEATWKNLETDAKNRSALVLHPFGVSGTGDERDEIQDEMLLLSKMFNDAGFRWRWAENGEEIQSTGLHLLLRMGMIDSADSEATTKTAGQDSGDPVNASSVEKKDDSSEETPALSRQYLVAFSLNDGSEIAREINDIKSEDHANVQRRKWVEIVGLKVIEELKSLNFSNEGLERRILMHYRYNPPHGQIDWFSIANQLNMN